MCVPKAMEALERACTRRGFFKRLGAVTAVAATAPAVVSAQPAPRSLTYERVVDLTHVLHPGFATFDGIQRLAVESATTTAQDGYYSNWWRVHEHTGTHMDAPIHFGEGGVPVHEVAAETLVAPAVVVDISVRAAEDPDTLLVPGDLIAWEAAHGAIPDGAAVLMNSGWAERVGDPVRFRNADDEGVLHFPGFHPEAAAFLLERNVVGIGVDTISLDHGASTDFGVHLSWLPANRWGLENVANLDQLPQVGATLVVGAPKVQGASGGPARVLALV